MIQKHDEEREVAKVINSVQTGEKIGKKKE